MKAGKKIRPDYDAGDGKRLRPSFTEDAGKAQRNDNDRIRRGLDSSSDSPARRAQRQQNAGRALTRTMGRAGALGAAGIGGYELGRAIDKATGASGKIADMLMSRKDARVADMLKQATTGIAGGTLANDFKDAPRQVPNPPPESKRAVPSPKPSVREGANSGIDDDVRARARRFVAEMNPEAEAEAAPPPPMEDEGGRGYAKGGMVKRNKGDGIAQRGLTRGKVV